MLQPSQLTDSLLLLGAFILMIAIFIPTFLWGMRKTISKLQQSPDFTELDVDAIRRQMLALLVGAPLILLFFALGRLVSDQPTPGFVFIALILGFAPLAYIAVSTIRNRVTFGGRSVAVKGKKAVRNGVISLVFLVLSFGGFALYFALYFASLK
jgi:hypothetical protein